jgi:PPM family protein phosphatase
VSGWLVGARTDVGLVRDGNEDALYAGTRLLVVADGVGGSVAGEIASKLAVTALAPLDTDASITDPLEALSGAVQRADEALRVAIAREPALSGMGTTLTAILWAGDSVGLAQLGDSRAYLFRGGEMSQITRDHTLVQSLVDEGQITAEEALVHPRRSWILRALDGRGEVEPDLDPLAPVLGDRYLLCSDGLSDYVDAAAISETVAEGADPQAICDRLVELALQAGAPDNVTCIVAEPVESPPPMTRPIIAGAAAAPDREPAGDRDRPVLAAAAGAVERAGARPKREPGEHGIGRRIGIVAAIVVLLVVTAAGGTLLYIRSQWYVAADQGNVAVYRGVQGNAAGLSLSRLEQRSNLPASALPQDDRDRLTNGITASGQSAAQSVVDSLRQETCALVTPSPTPQPTTSSTSKPRHHKGTVPRQPVTPPTPIWCAATP